MEEHINENEEKNVIERLECKEGHCWLKYLVITLAAFLGAFLAVYFVADNVIHRYILPIPSQTVMSPVEFNDFIKQQENMFEDITSFKTPINPFMIDPVKMQTYQDGNDYKIILDLKAFDNDPDKIKLDIKANKVKISGESDSETKDGEKDISFMQNFSLPQKINVKAVKKEVKDNKYIITLPIKK